VSAAPSKGPRRPPRDDIGWAVLELTNQKRIAGYITEALLAGIPTFRVEIPTAGKQNCVQFYAATAMHCLTLTTVDVVRVLAAHPEATLEPRPPAFARGHASVTKAPAPSAKPGGAS
jgi:hypothetical protein